MLLSTLMLAMGVLLLWTARLSGNPSAYGIVVLGGIVLVAIGCAMHLAAATDAVVGHAALRAIAHVAVWLGIGAGTVWLVGRAPRDDVLLGLLLVPSFAGVAGLIVTRRSAWPAAVFMVGVALLILVVGPVWVARHTPG